MSENRPADRNPWDTDIFGPKTAESSHKNHF